MKDGIYLVFCGSYRCDYFATVKEGELVDLQRQNSNSYRLSKVAQATNGKKWDRAIEQYRAVLNGADPRGRFDRIISMRHKYTETDQREYEKFHNLSKQGAA